MRGLLEYVLVPGPAKRDLQPVWEVGGGDLAFFDCQFWDEQGSRRPVPDSQTPRLRLRDPVEGNKDLPDSWRAKVLIPARHVEEGGHF